MSSPAIIPIFLNDNFKSKQDTFHVSLCISMFNIGGAISSPIHSITLSKIGRPLSMAIALILLSITQLVLGIASYFSYENFIIITCICKFIQGYGDSLLMSVSFSLASIYFKDEKEKMVMIIELALSVGMACSPLVLSGIYALLNYDASMYFMSFLYFLELIFVWLLNKKLTN